MTYSDLRNLREDGVARKSAWQLRQEWAEAVDRLLDLTGEMAELIPPPRMWFDAPGELAFLRSDALLAIHALRMGDRLRDANIAGRYGAAINELISLANLTMEALPLDLMEPFPGRYNRLTSNVFEAHRYFNEIAEAIDLEIAIVWHFGYAEVASKFDEYFPQPAEDGAPGRRVMLGRDVRAQVWAKSDGHCWYCGRPTNPFVDFRVDHVVPIAGGGSNLLDNLVPACHRCNAAKGALSLQQFRERRGGRFWFEEREASS